MTNRIRIATGLILFIFVLVHLLSLSFGLVSLETLETMRPILMAPWSNPVGGMILLICLLAHAGLGLWSLFTRPGLRMTASDLLQALLGIATVPLLLPHIMGTAVNPAITGADVSYTWILAVYWLFAPKLGLQQVLALIVIWIHGCYGLLLWIRVQDWWGRFGGLVYPFCVVIPVMALLGFVEAGRELMLNRSDPELRAIIRETARQYDSVAQGLWTAHDTILVAYAVILAALVLARLLREARSRKQVSLAYDGGQPFSIRTGSNLLELARGEDVLHAALCGGRGRCGSCAVRVISGGEHLTPADETELATLKRIDAADGFRLACQAVPLGGHVEVERVFPAHLTPADYRELRSTGEAISAARTMLSETSVEAGA